MMVYMEQVWISAAGLSLATMLGAVIGFIVKELPHKWNDIVLGFCAGLRAVDVFADYLETVLLGVLHAVLELSLDAALVLSVGTIARVDHGGLSGVRWVLEFHFISISLQCISRDSIYKHDENRDVRLLQQSRHNIPLFRALS